MTTQVEPINDSDVSAVAQFLSEHLNDRVGADAWSRAMEAPWPVEAPNHGFMLLEDERVVGVYLAFYSDRRIRDRVERFCNLGAWCVVPSHRRHSLRLLTALLAQDGYHFTDLSPSGNVVPLNTRLRFQFLDTTTALVPNLPWPSRPGRFVVSGDPEVIGRTLTGPQLDIYRDHAATAAARHLVVIEEDDWCYVIYRRDRRKNLPVFASILHVSNPELFQRASRRITRHLLVRGALATLAELRVVGHRPALPGLMLRSPRRKMFRSSTLDASDVDYLYSELVCVAW